MNILKSIIIIITLLFCREISFSQQKIQQDVVYLNNGSVIFGKITEQSNNKVKIKSTGNLWVYDNSEIQKIVLDSLVKIDYYSIQNNIINKARGLYFNLNTGILAGNGQMENTYTTSIQAILGYRNDPYLRIGLGTAIEDFHIPVLPVFINMQTSFGQNQAKTYLDLKTGYAFPLTKEATNSNNYSIYSSYYNSQEKYTGGLNIEFLLGGKFRLAQHSEMQLGIGYRYQKLKGKTENDYQKVEKIYEYNRIVIRFGITFL